MQTIHPKRPDILGAENRVEQKFGMERRVHGPL